jgi:hypothetical protein
MPFMTMWDRDGRRCLILVGPADCPYVVRILEHGQIVREECVDSADDALLIASRWEEQEEHRIGCAA